MATRWLCSSAAALSLAACVTHTTTYYKPSEGESRLDQDEFRQASDDLLKVECPRLMAPNASETGAAKIRVRYDRSGAVQQAEILHSSGDDRIDTMWGALAARLKFDPQEGQSEDLRAGIINVGYSCAPNTAVTTFQLQ
jgi:TonB family protein